MDWNQLKDWKIIGSIMTGIATVIAWIKTRPKETAEIIKAKAEARKSDAETRKTNREIDASENSEINQLRQELNQVREDLRQALLTIDKLTRRLTVYETFKSSLKK